MSICLLTRRKWHSCSRFSTSGAQSPKWALISLAQKSLEIKVLSIKRHQEFIAKALKAYSKSRITLLLMLQTIFYLKSFVKKTEIRLKTIYVLHLLTGTDFHYISRWNTLRCCVTPQACWLSSRPHLRSLLEETELSLIVKKTCITARFFKTLRNLSLSTMATSQTTREDLPYQQPRRWCSNSAQRTTRF